MFFFWAFSFGEAFHFGFPLKALRFPHTYINGVLFFSLINVGHHNPPPSRPSVFTCTPPNVYPFRRKARKLTHRPMSDSDIICLLADIVFFELFLLGFPSRLKNASAIERFPHLSYEVKSVLFSSPANTGRHIMSLNYIIFFFINF